MPPVATTTPSLTRGDALPMRLMAPSTITWSAPSAWSRSTVTRSSASVVGPLTSTAPSPAASADHDASERSVEGQLLERLHRVAGALERALCRGHERALRRSDARLGEAGEVVGALAVEAEGGEAEAQWAVGHERVHDGRLAGVLDEADDGQRVDPGAGDDVVESLDGGRVGPHAGRAGAAAAGHRSSSSAPPPRGVPAADLLEVGEDRVAREVERVGDLLGGALDEEGAALLEALDDLHLLLARHGRRGLAHLADGLGDHAGDHVADVAGEDLPRLGGRAAAEAADGGEVGERALGLHDLGDVVVEAEQAVRLAVLVPQGHGERLEDLAVVRRDVEAHILGLVGVAQVAEHAVGGHVADGAAAHGAVLDGDDGMGKPADVVQDDLAVRAEHLGQAADDGQQRLHARVEREQTTLRRLSWWLRRPGIHPRTTACQKKWAAYPKKWEAARNDRRRGAARAPRLPVGQRLLGRSTSVTSGPASCRRARP